MMIVWSFVSTDVNITKAVDGATEKMQEWINRRESEKNKTHVVKLQSQLIMHEGKATYVLTAVFEYA